MSVGDIAILIDSKFNVLAVSKAFRRFLFMVDIRGIGGKLSGDDMFFLAGSPGVNKGLCAVRFLLIKDAFRAFHLLPGEIRLGEGYAQGFVRHFDPVVYHLDFRIIPVIAGVPDHPGFVYGKEDIRRRPVAFRDFGLMVAVILPALQDAVKLHGLCGGSPCPDQAPCTILVLHIQLQ